MEEKLNLESGIETGISLESGIETGLSLESGIETEVSLGSGIAAQFDDGYAEFNGTDAYIEILDDDLFTFINGANDAPFSLSAWILLTDATDSVIIGKYVPPLGNREWILLLDSDDKLQFFLYHENDSANIKAISNDVLTENIWIFISATYDGSKDKDGLKLYIDGVLINSTNTESNSYDGMENTATPVRIGVLKPIWPFDGKMKDVKVFDVELSDAEVLSEYENNNRTTDLVAHYKLVDNAEDSGDNGFNGSNVGDNVSFRSNFSMLELESSLL